MFRRKTLDFLAENRFRDRKEWFDSRKVEYAKYVTEPLTEFVESLALLMVEIEPLLITKPKNYISKIHQDTRFSKYKFRYRNIMWCAFNRFKIESGLLGFFFKI